MEFLAIGGLLVLLGIREYFSYKERKDLYTRLMAKDLQEYTQEVTPEEDEDETNEDDGMVDISVSEAGIGSIPDEIREEMSYGGQETE